MNHFHIAKNYIKKFVDTLVQNAKVEFELHSPNPVSHTLFIEVQEKRVPVIFLRFVLQSFGKLKNEDCNSEDYFDLKNHIEFQIYIALGKEGLIPEVDIISKLLSDKRKWFKDPYAVDLTFNDYQNGVFKFGLSALLNSLKRTIKTHPIYPEDIPEDIKAIENLIRYYQTNNNFSSNGISLKSLGYLKSAAICKIAKLQHDKNICKIKRIIKSLDKEIFSIVEMLEADHFSSVKLPDCASEHIAYIKDLLVEKKQSSIKQENNKSQNIHKKEEIKHNVKKGNITSISSKSIWLKIEKDFGINKRVFAKKINFVKDIHQKRILLRDVEHAYILSQNGFSKPAIILAGSVIEELLRSYLNHKNITPSKDTFDGYIKACEDNKLLKSGISKLSDYVRHFRNYVHIKEELNSKHSMSKVNAKNAVSSLLVIVSEF